MKIDKKRAGQGFRQGDVLVIPVTSAPRGEPLQPIGGRFVLADGEMTGHSHSVALSDRIAMFREDGSGGGLIGFVTGEPVPVTHQEHTALPMPVGECRVIRQRTLVSGLVRRVAD